MFPRTSVAIKPVILLVTAPRRVEERGDLVVAPTTPTRPVTSVALKATLPVTARSEQAQVSFLRASQAFYPVSVISRVGEMPG